MIQYANLSATTHHTHLGPCPDRRGVSWCLTSCSLQWSGTAGQYGVCAFKGIFKPAAMSFRHLQLLEAELRGSVTVNRTPLEHRTGIVERSGADPPLVWRPLPSKSLPPCRRDGGDEGLCDRDGPSAPRTPLRSALRRADDVETVGASHAAPPAPEARSEGRSEQLA